MSDIVSPLLQWLNTHPEFAGLFTFIISASESIAIIGTIVPGSITMTAIGALAGAGVIPLWETLIWAIVGAVVGDGISYWIGHHFKDRLRKMWPFTKYPDFLESGEAFVHKYGGMSVFIGRFVGPVRALVPLVAGMLGMKPLRFLVANVISAIGWAPAYMLPGILLGAASLELPPDIAIHVILVFLLITLFVMLCLWLAYKLLHAFHQQTDQMQDTIWQYFKKHAALSPLTRLLKHHDPTYKHGQLNLAFYFLLTGFFFICLALYGKHVGPANVEINGIVFHLFRGIRTPWLDTFMLNCTLLGQKQVILPVILIVFLWLILWRRWRAAFHALALGILAAGSVFFFKHLLKSPRPWGITVNPETFSMPSGHTALSISLYMGLAFLMATAIRPKYRWMIYTPALLIVSLVSISRLYLGAHWFTDVLAGWLIAAAVLMFVIISYDREKEDRINPASIGLVTLISLSITFSFYHYTHFRSLKMAYTQINWPIEKISITPWWDHGAGLAVYRVSLFGVPSDPVNIIWAGNEDKIRQSLLRQGWTNPPPRDWISTLHRIADVQSTEYLSMVSPQYLDKRPEVILTRRAEGVKGLLVLRLWNAYRIISQTHETLWVGTLGMIPRSYSWIYLANHGRMEINPEDVFPQHTPNAWEWKIVSRQTGHTNQKIMLIRKK